MRKSLIAIGVVVMAAAAGGWWFYARHRAGGVRANDVILVTIDTLRADALGYAGNTRVQTPFLDSLAARGVVFTNAHAHNVITLPSHVNILTGLYPFQHGVRENAGFKLDPKFPTVATMLRPLGYATGAFVGAFPLDRRFGLDQGFDVYDDTYGKGEASVDFVVQERRASVVLDAASKWWEANAGKKRFLWVHLYDAHAPYSPPEPFFSQFRSNEYLGEISYVDSELSRVLGPMLAKDPSALLIVTADHGEARGDHGEQTHGLFAYESTLKIPLLVIGPGLQHRVQAGYVRHIDIVPTILAAVGGTRTVDLRGESLLDVTDGKGTPRDTYFESLSTQLNRGWAPLTGIIHSGEKFINLPIAELYDLPRDPHELTNLREERRRDADEARRLLEPMLKSPAPAGRTVDADTLAKLRSLGYISGTAPASKVYTAADDPKNLVGLDSEMHDAVSAFETHHPEKALALTHDVVMKRPDMTAAREMFAFMLEQNDRVPEAIEQLRIVVAAPGASDSSAVQLALLLSQNGRANEALQVLEPRLASKDPDLLNAYGVALLNAGRPDDAARQFESILKIDPNDAPALQNLGILSLQRGNVESAQSYLSRALSLNPKLPLALNTMGVVYARNNDLQGAVDMWNRAVEIDPRQYDALFNIALVERQLGHTEESKKALARFVATAPRSQYGADIAAAERQLATMR
ncbi:MAG TPA: sulfatase-like hydrolase/transferase [Thermoanaerobaculia bacterium]|jgi:arylsulfatase A-like enzyme/Flp pilus assembly protein TadD